MRKKFRFLTVLAVCVMVLSCFSVTAFAYADDTEQNLPVTEATQPEQQPAVTPTPEKPKGEPIDDEGNAYTRDLLYDKATNKQFITVQTKNGNTFFIVIDYDAPINEDEEQYQTYFLNMVDESDLLALLDDDTAAALTTCNCKEKCAAGQVNTDCPVCKTNMSECTGTAPATPEPDKDAETDVPAPKPEKKSNVGMILVIFALVSAAGAAYYYIKFVNRCRRTELQQVPPVHSQHERTQELRRRLFCGVAEAHRLCLSPTHQVTVRENTHGHNNPYHCRTRYRRGVHMLQARLHCSAAGRSRPFQIPRHGAVCAVP